MFLSEWREFPSVPWLAGGKKNLMIARVSMLLKSRASLTCFRACFLPGRAKDLSAPGYLSLPRVELCLSKEQLLKCLKVSGLECISLKFWINIRTHARTHTHHSHKYWYYTKHNLWTRLQHAWGVERTWLDRRSCTTFTTGALSNYDLPPLPAEWTMTTYWPRSDPHAIWLYLFNQLYLMSPALNSLLRSVIMEVIGGMWHSVFMWREFNVLFFTLHGVKLISNCGKKIRDSWGYLRTDVWREYVELR